MTFYETAVIVVGCVICFAIAFVTESLLAAAAGGMCLGALVRDRHG